jgi:hypothetical protein
VTLEVQKPLLSGGHALGAAKAPCIAALHFYWKAYDSLRRDNETTTGVH